MGFLTCQSQLSVFFLECHMVRVLAPLPPELHPGQLMLPPVALFCPAFKHLCICVYLFRSWSLKLQFSITNSTFQDFLAALFTVTCLKDGRQISIFWISNEVKFTEMCPKSLERLLHSQWQQPTPQGIMLKASMETLPPTWHYMSPGPTHPQYHFPSRKNSGLQVSPLHTHHLASLSSQHHQHDYQPEK